MSVFQGTTINNEPRTAWKAVYAACRKFSRFIVKVDEYNQEKELSDQQRAWWKGILLPALAKDTGESESKWEAILKLSVMPDEFKPVTITVGENGYSFIPSITNLSTKKMSQLIEGSVAKLHDWGFLWVTLPDPELRK